MNVKLLAMYLGAMTVLTALPTTACTSSHVPEPKAEGDRPPHGPGGPHHGPPKEAVEACKSRKQGDECSFKMHDDTVTGTCEKGPEGDTLACRPEGGPPPPQR